MADMYDNPKLKRLFGNICRKIKTCAASLTFFSFSEQIPGCDFMKHCGCDFKIKENIVSCNRSQPAQPIVTIKNL